MRKTLAVSPGEPPTDVPAVTIVMSDREANRARSIARAYPNGLPAMPVPGQGEPFTRTPSSVHNTLAAFPRAHVLWVAVESWVGKHGGSADVPQRAIIRQLGWPPSTYWTARRLLIQLGMLTVEMPREGQRRHGPGARRRLRLVQFLPRAVRRGIVRTASKVQAKAQRALGLHPAAADAMARALERASAPTPTATGPPD